MNTRKRARRATTIDVVNNIPTKQGNTKRTTRNSFSNNITEMNNSNPETEMPTTNESGNENETANSNAAEDEDSTQPLFCDSDPSDILAQADLLLARMDAYALETASQQNNFVSNCQHSSDTKQNPSTSTTGDEMTDSTLNERNSNQNRTAENINRSANDSLRSASTTNESQNDDSVILIDDFAMPRPSRSDEDVIFVEQYVKEPPRITGVVDLCDEDEEKVMPSRAQRRKFSPMPSAQVGLAASPQASTSNRIVVKCPVCLDSVPNEEVYSTICGHLFCFGCIRSTIKARKKCPMCNRTLTANQIHRIYFHN